jgi:heme-degrading monooxygenase HmoA
VTVYAVIRRLRVGRDIDEAIERANSMYARAVEQQVGFVDYNIVRTGEDELVTLIYFEAEDEARRVMFHANEFVGVGLAGLDAEVLEQREGEVVVNTATAAALEQVPADEPETGDQAGAG